MRHEQVAAHAADGYARQTGKLGCVVTTAGPGCTNAVTGIATAFRSESPILHIGGQGGLAQHKMGSLQDLPHIDMMRPITKFSASVRSTERIADMISMAARECFTGAYGPAYLEIPRDVLDREVDIKDAVVPKPGHYRASTRSIGDPADIEKLADILVKAERPAILFGQQVWTARGHEEAIALLQGPRHSRLLQRRQPRAAAARRSRTTSTARAALAFSKADVIVIVGTPFDFRMGYGKRIQVPTLVQIDMDYRTVGKNRDIDLGLVGRPGRDPRRRARRGERAHRRTASARRAAVDEAASRRASDRHRQADAAVHVQPVADPSVPRRLRDQRVPWARTRSTSATAATW